MYVLYILLLYTLSFCIYYSGADVSTKTHALLCFCFLSCHLIVRVLPILFSWFSNKLFCKLASSLSWAYVSHVYRYPYRGSLRPAYLSICQPPRPGTPPWQVDSTVGRFLLTRHWDVDTLRSCIAFPFGLSLPSYCPPRLFFSFLAVRQPFFSGRSISHLFLLLLTAFLAALSFSSLSRLGRLFSRPASVARCAVKKPSHRCLVALYYLYRLGYDLPFSAYSVSRRAASLPPCMRLGRLFDRSPSRLVGH